MQGKSRVMAAVAAGALTVALGAGAARCAIAPQEGAQDSPQEQEQPAAAGADAATGKAASGAEALWNTAWTGADDPTATLRIVEGAMVESAGGTERAWFFSAEEPSEAGGVLSVPIEVKGTGDKAGGLSLIQVSGSGDARTLACDLLTQAYVPQKAQDGAFSVTGTDDRLSKALGADSADIKDIVAKKAAGGVPAGDGSHLGQGGVARLRRERRVDDLHARRPRLDGGHRGLARRLAGGDVAMRALKAQRRRAFAISAAAAFALCALLLVPAQPAYADIAGDVNDWLCGLLRDCCNWMFKAQTGVLGSIGANGILSADFAHMLTSSSDLTMHDVARGVWQVAILPIGCGVLGLVFTLKLIEISQRMDGSQSLPGVKEVVFLLVFFAVFLFLIQNSFDLMASIYEVCGLAIDRVEALFGAGGALDLPEVSVVTTDDDIPSLIAMLVVSLISWVVVLAAYVVALVVCWARALQLYIMAAFAPIPLAFLGMDATRQIGLGYLKSFGAVCIAGVIILVLLISFPLVLGGLTGANPGTGTPADAVANGLTYALQYLAMCVLLILALVKSGSWARDIVSGF